MNIKELWDSVLVEIELSVSSATFNTWFKDTHIQKHEDGIIYISVPNQFVRDWLFNKYHKTILKAVRDRAGEVRNVEYVIGKPARTQKQKTFREQPRGGELPFEDVYINKEDNLNPRYDFDSFVVGPFNELAYAAAQAVIKKPGTTYNPLFIYGNTGHGKTHLIQAIGNKMKELYSGKKCYYLTSEKFAVDFLNSIQVNRVNAFKEKYRDYDVLIMDDIQFLSNKDKTQEELFHLFNALYDANKQIVFSSDKHPNYIQNLEERLKSRFGAGMIVDIPPPDHDSRVAIITAKAKHSNFSLSRESVEHLASAVEGNVRDLEGILNTVIMQAEMKGRDLDISELQSITKTSVKPRKQIAIKDVIKTISEFYNIDEKVIFEKTRKKEVVRPRQMIMFILREDFKISFPLIGQKLGGRDHTTVIHSCDRVREELKNNSEIYNELSQIRAML
ncbi:MAG: chromosomal replication initiator protein DnaA [Candidatus Campbellbacteria bacterium]|nr:chromosomal replication initiator protein DnaA [Candidatus Campbellbacteria bacterium]